MKEFIFFVQGSAIEPYRVTFRKNGGKLSAYCTCPAGENGQHCKHRFNILVGLSNGIVSGNEDDAAVVTTWLPGTEVESAMNNVMDTEKQFETAKRNLALAKKKLAMAFKD